MGFIARRVTRIHFLLFLGTSLLNGFAERPQYELSLYRNDLNIISVQNRKTLSYAGASKYSLSNFIQQLWLTKKEFDDTVVY